MANITTKEPMATACKEASQTSDLTLFMYVIDLNIFLTSCERIHLHDVDTDLADYDN